MVGGRLHRKPRTCVLRLQCLAEHDPARRLQGLRRCPARVVGRAGQQLGRLRGAAGAGLRQVCTGSVAASQRFPFVSIQVNVRQDTLLGAIKLSENKQPGRACSHHLVLTLQSITLG